MRWHFQGLPSLPVNQERASLLYPSGSETSSTEIFRYPTTPGQDSSVRSPPALRNSAERRTTDYGMGMMHSARLWLPNRTLQSRPATTRRINAEQTQKPRRHRPNGSRKQRSVCSIRVGWTAAKTGAQDHKGWRLDASDAACHTERTAIRTECCTNADSVRSAASSALPLTRFPSGPGRCRPPTPTVDWSAEDEPDLLQTGMGTPLFNQARLNADLPDPDGIRKEQPGCGEDKRRTADTSCAFRTTGP